MLDKKYEKLISYSDGGARGNPGPAGIGALLMDEQGEVVAEISEYIGETTNNQAEYRALLAAMLKAKDLRASCLEAFLDSELVVRQIKGEYKVKNKELLPLFMEICRLRLEFNIFHITHVRREQNKQADALANQAMDRGTGTYV